MSSEAHITAKKPRERLNVKVTLIRELPRVSEEHDEKLERYGRFPSKILC